MDDGCTEIIDKFPGVAGRNLRNKKAPNKIHMGTKVLGKGQKSKLKSSSATSQITCSSMSPLNPIRENGKMMDMEEQMPELVDDSENKDSSTSVNQQSQPLRTFGLARLNNMGVTTENLGQSVNVTFEVDNGNSRNTPPKPHVLLNDVSQKQSESD